MLLGGLTAADISSSEIRLLGASGDRRLGFLPAAIHDAAAVRLGKAVYLFGGGNLGQSDAIVRVDPATGKAAIAGRLPAAGSDVSAAAVAGTAYIVGGFTGREWLDTVVAWRPGTRAHVVGHLPVPLRYAAATAVAGRVVIAGGSTPTGSASRLVLAFDPRRRRLQRLGRLPAPTTHAAAATINGLAYVIGGRGAALGTPTSAVTGIDVAARRIFPAGHLRRGLSDLAAVPTRGRVLVAGGRDARGTQARRSELVPVGARTQASAPRRGAASPATRGTRHRVQTRNVYAADMAGMLSPVARQALSRVYVPNSESNTVDVIDPATYKVVDHFAVGALPQHVTPSYDLKTLYVLNDEGNSVTPIDPTTGRPRSPIPVDDPYNMYFTPDGRSAIVVAERLHRLDFRDPHTMNLQRALHVPCSGVDHMDFSADGRYLIASCEFSSSLIKVDVHTRRVVGSLRVDRGNGKPQDVKLSPDGKTFYVADMNAGGLWKVDGRRLRMTGFVATGMGVHGLYPSRDTRFLYATNRGEGSISVISFATQKVVKKWRIPGGGSPDMGGVSADGRVLWLTGRYNAVVYAISTKDGRLLARIPVGGGPHGLAVWPQPGRYSLGHTGIMR